MTCCVWSFTVICCTVWVRVESRYLEKWKVT